MSLRRGVVPLLVMLLFLPSSGQVLAATKKASGVIPVSASTPPTADSFQLTVAPASPPVLGDGATTTYTVTYGSTRKVPTEPVVLELEWTRATVTGSTTQRDLLQYQLGSATRAFGGAPPVLDPLHRKVRWFIPSLPPGTTNQSVSLTLRAKADGLTTPAAGLVRIRLLVPQVSLTDVTRPYLYQPPVNPAPTAPTSPLNFESLTIDAVTATTATVRTQTSQPTTNTLASGTSVAALTDTQTDVTLEPTHQFELTGLLPETTYYVRVTATAASGEAVVSDLVLIRTAAASTAPAVNAPSLIISSGGTVLSDGSLESNPTIVIPSDTSYEFTVNLSSDGSVTSAQAVIEPAELVPSPPVSLLPADRSQIQSPIDASGNARPPSSWSLVPSAQAAAPSPTAAIEPSQPGRSVTDLIPTQPGTFTGRLVSALQPGIYPLSFRVTDTKSNLITLPGFRVKVVPRLTVVDARTNEPIEQSRILLQRKDESSRIFADIPSYALGFANPTHTISDGTAAVTVPKGNYQYEASAIGFRNQTDTFTIGAAEGEEFPRIALEPAPVTLVTLTQYYWHSLQDFLQATRAYLRAISASNRLFDLVGLLVLAASVLLTLVAFRSRTHVPIRTLPQYFLSLLTHTFVHQRHRGVLHGRVLDSSGAPISRAVIHFVNTTTNQIQGETQTDRLGNFFAPQNVASCAILVTRQGYTPQSLTVNWNAPATAHQLTIRLEATKRLPAPLSSGVTVLELLLGMSFELFLCLSLFLEILFLLTFGWQKTLIFLTISLLNLAAWIFVRLAEHRSTVNNT